MRVKSAVTRNQITCPIERRSSLVTRNQKVASHNTDILFTRTSGKKPEIVVKDFTPLRFEFDISASQQNQSHRTKSASVQNKSKRAKLFDRTSSMISNFREMCEREQTTQINEAVLEEMQGMNDRIIKAIEKTQECQNNAI